MQINGKKIKVYLSDTVDTIKDRIAISMNTLPQYLVFDPELENTSQTGNIVVVNVLASIINSKDTVFPEDKINFDKISREDAERLFIVTHDITNSNKSAEDIKMFLTYTISGLTTLNAITILNDRQTIMNKMKDNLDRLKKKVDATTLAFEEFDNIPSINTAEYEVSTVQFSIRLAIQGSINVPELYNSLTVTKMAPYAVTGSADTNGPFYKIFHDFSPNPDWLELETPNVILVKVNGETTADLRQLKNKYKKYADTAFTVVTNSSGQCEVVATLNMSVGYRNVSRDVFIDRALQIFPTLNRTMITHMNELSTGGFITYPNQTILIPIWAEMCLNNPFFNKIVALNESIRASKTKLNAYMYVINTSDILSVTMKETEKPNMYGMEDEGSNFIRVRVKVKTIEESLRYQKILGRLFNLYNNERDLILAEYRKYLGPKFLRDEQTKLIKRPRKLEKLELRAIAPDIFLPTYSRKCLKRPTIINKERANQYRRNRKKQVIEFPVYGESIKRYYMCDHDTHPYPGLRENTLDNKIKFPYIPCCYTKDQNRVGTKFRHYYQQETLNIKNSAVQDIFISGKTLRPGLPGTLPSNIKKLFSIIEPNPQFQFIRVGSNLTKSSFLECVMLALNIKNIQFLQVEDRIPVVQKMRKEITTEINAMAAKQEFYDEPVDVIMDKMSNSNLNALEFGHVLELVFNCNIFVLSASDKDPDGTIHIPRHAQAYYKMKPTRATVFVYQHDINTNDVDFSQIQCELITRTKTPDMKILDNMDTSFPHYDHVVEKMWAIFRNLNRSFSHNSMLPSISIPRLNVKSQVIDVYGKCRVVNIDFNGNMITMVSEPLPPYNAGNATQVYRTSLEILKEFAKVTNVLFVQQRVSAGRVREVMATMSKGNLKVTFLCDDTNKLEGVLMNYDREDYSELLKLETTVVSQFNHNKKIAKIIYQYGLYFMSRFMHAKGYTTKPLNEQQLLDFINQHILIKPNHVFTSRNISSKYSLDSQFVDQQSKVITTSKEMLVRLIYSLRLYQNTHFDELIAYKDRLYIGDFYDEISDFDHSPSQFLLDTPSAVIGLIENYKTNNIVIKNVRVNHSHPYFIYNPSIADQIYLAQNVLPVYGEGENMIVVKSGLHVASELVKFWDRYGYNGYMGDVEDVGGDKPVDVYSYVNVDEVTNLTNHSDALPGMVLGYLVNGEALYTALMPL